MAASSPHQSAAPHLLTSRSPRDDSAATCGDAAFARAPQPTNAMPLGGKLTLPGLPQPCAFALGLGSAAPSVWPGRPRALEVFAQRGSSVDPP